MKFRTNTKRPPLDIQEGKILRQIKLTANKNIMNIAQAFFTRYESKDFKANYAAVLYEDFGNDEGTIIDRILNLFNVQNYEVENNLKNYKKLDREQGQKIYDFIYENFEEFTTDFVGHYVGPVSLDSVSYGEQEEQLTGIYNSRTGKNYSLPYLKKICDQEGFAVNKNYAYYIVSGGLHIDLLNNTELLDQFLLTL